MIYDSAAVDEVLLALKIAFLVLLYLFIWRIVRTGSRDLRVPQESFILAPSATGGVKPAIPRLEPSGRLVVVKSGDLAPGRGEFLLHEGLIHIRHKLRFSADVHAGGREQHKPVERLSQLVRVAGVHVLAAPLEPAFAGFVPKVDPLRTDAKATDCRLDIQES